MSTPPPCPPPAPVDQEEEEREEEKRQRDEEAKQLLEEEAKGEAHWAVVREKLEQKKEVRLVRVCGGRQRFVAATRCVLAMLSAPVRATGCPRASVKFLPYTPVSLCTTPPPPPCDEI